MYASIVVGTDGSEAAGKAVEAAVGLAKRFGARLHVVTAYRPPAASRMAAMNAEAIAFGGADLLERAETTAMDQVEGMLSRIGDDLRSEGVGVETHAEAGDPAEAVLEVAEREGADLIVVGSRGMTGGRRFLLGSVPNKVSHHAGCSVLIVRTC